MIEDLSGFWDQVDSIVVSPKQESILPTAFDSFLSARFFAKQALNLIPVSTNIQTANWYINAHVTSTISIRDHAKNDYVRKGKSDKFNNSAIGREFYLQSVEVDGVDGDPLSINRAFKDLRNLVVHYGPPLVEIKPKLLDQHSSDDDTNASDAWYLRPIDLKVHRQMKDRLLLDDQVITVNDHFKHKTLANVVGQQLYGIYRALIESLDDFNA